MSDQRFSRHSITIYVLPSAATQTPPTAVLFYSEVGFTCRVEPGLYRHPKHAGSRSAAFDVVRQRLLIGEQIVEPPAHEHQLLTALQPVNLEETG